MRIVAALTAFLLSLGQGHAVVIDFGSLPEGTVVDFVVPPASYTEDGFDLTATDPSGFFGRARGGVFQDEAFSDFNNISTVVQGNTSFILSAASGQAFDLLSFLASAFSPADQFSLEVVLERTTGTTVRSFVVADTMDLIGINETNLLSATFRRPDGSSLGNGRVDDINVEAAPVPLPAAVWLFASFLGLAAVRRAKTR